MRQRGHKVVLLDLLFGYPGEFSDPSELFERDWAAEQHSVGESAPDIEALRRSRGDCPVGDNVISVCKAADITFLALHGDIGENGKLQALLDVNGVKYTGSGYLGSALAMNKGVSKKLFAASGIPTPPGVTVTKSEPPYADIGFPCVVKPCSGGSSVGTSIVNDAQQYEEALNFAFKYEQTVIVEKYIKGRELTVGVLDSKAMPAIEIIPNSGFYDYKNKYQPGLTRELCPAPLTPEQTEAVSRLAERVAKCLLIDAYCRADFFMSEDDGTMYCLEANTLPGMTPTSLIPQMAAQQGMDFGELCEKIIEVSMKKYAEE